MAQLEFVSSGSWHINAPAPVGNKRLRGVESFDEDDESSVETKCEVAPGADAAGFVRIPGGKSITFEGRALKGAKPDVDWEYLQDNEIVFTLTKELTGGRRKQYLPCQVSTYKEKGDNKGEYTYTVEVKALGKKLL